MKTHDTLGRRDRFKRLPLRLQTAAPLSPTAGDIAMMEAIHRHGPLSSIYLPEFRRPLHESRQGAVRRLNLLFNETNTVDGGAYLTRPPQQARTENAFRKHLVYDLTPAAIKCMQRLGRWSANAPANRNPWTHSFMVSSVTASIEIMCRRKGYTFIPGHEILDRQGVTLRQKVAFRWEGERKVADLIPDALFAIDYGGKFRAFLVEADRGSEPIATQTSSRKSMLRNLLQYRSFVGDQLYKEAYGLNTRAVVLNVFTNPSRMKTAIWMVEKHSKANSYLLFRSIDEFGVVFSPPAVLAELFDDGWSRAGREAFDISYA